MSYGGYAFVQRVSYMLCCRLLMRLQVTNQRVVIMHSPLSSMNLNLSYESRQDHRSFSTCLHPLDVCHSRPEVLFYRTKGGKERTLANIPLKVGEKDNCNYSCITEYGMSCKLFHPRDASKRKPWRGLWSHLIFKCLFIKLWRNNGSRPQNTSCKFFFPRLCAFNVKCVAEQTCKSKQV